MIEASVSGIPFCNVSDTMWNELTPGMELGLEREPTNQWDKNAVKVLYRKHMIGYIEKEVAIHIAKTMDKGAYKVICKIVAKRGMPNDKPILAIALY